MSYREPTYADLTAYPKFFNQCYWGQFQLRYNGKAASSPPNPAIVEARNKFVAEHRIVAYKHNNSSFHVSSLDHQEFYVDKEKRVVHIYSHYKSCGVHPEFRLIQPLYAMSQVTCLRKIETTFSKKLLMKTLFSRIPDDAAALVNEYLLIPKKRKRARRF